MARTRKSTKTGYRRQSRAADVGPARARAGNRDDAPTVAGTRIAGAQACAPRPAVVVAVATAAQRRAGSRPRRRRARSASSVPMPAGGLPRRRSVAGPRPGPARNSPAPELRRLRGFLDGAGVDARNRIHVRRVAAGHGHRHRHALGPAPPEHDCIALSQPRLGQAHAPQPIPFVGIRTRHVEHEVRPGRQDHIECTPPGAPCIHRRRCHRAAARRGRCVPCGMGSWRRRAASR